MKGGVDPGGAGDRSCRIRPMVFLHVEVTFRMTVSKNAAPQKIFSSREIVFCIEKIIYKPLIYMDFYLLLYKT
jgi:hypothetical protein